MTENPYAAPSDVSSPPLVGNPMEHAESVRRTHINQEANIKSVGSLYVLGAIILFITGLVLVFTENAGAEKAVAGAIMVWGILQFFLGLAIRKLKPWTRIFIGIISGLGLLGFPLGTLINALILGMVFSKKGKLIFSPEYKVIISLTPHVKRKTSIIVWIALGIALLVILGGIAMVVIKDLAPR